MRSSEDTRDFALWSARNVTMGRERVGMYTMHTTHSLNDLCVATPHGAELCTTQKGAAIIARRCNSGYTEKVHVSIYGWGAKCAYSVKNASNLRKMWED